MWLPTGISRGFPGLRRVLAALAGARGTLFPWVPVAVALGIGLWFQLRQEPGPTVYAAVVAAGLALGALALRGPWLARPLCVFLACGALGFLAAGLRAWDVAAPMLEAPYYGPVQGRVVEIDRSQSGALRLTLDRPVLSGLAPDRTPLTLRVSLHGPPPGFELTAGQTVMMTARLDAPAGPAAPGAFDFRRMAWFEQLGGVGYTQTPVVLWQEPQGWDQAVSRLRLYLSHAIQAAVPGDAGAFASGAMTGDRSGISAQVVQDLRVSSLAHLLAISGMNLAFLVAFVFGLVRGGLALVPVVALRVNTKKLAALVAFGVAAFYLALSGANVATTRAFLMMVVILGAVLLDRRALSLRNVAISALLLLLWQPESLFGAGFQLSYAATVALIAGYEAVAARRMGARLPWAMRQVIALVLTSVIAGFATAPYAAAAFNRLSDYGLIANLLTVPVMSVLMGAGAVATLLAPFGLAGPALWVMGWAAEWILYVAHEISTLGGAMTAVISPHPVVIPLLSLGAAWLILWRGWLRQAGSVAIALAFGLWIVSPRPVALISSDGALVGILGAQGRALSTGSGAGYAAETWLQDDGDLALPAAAALRPGFDGPKGVRRFTLNGVEGVALSGKAGLAALPEACATAALVVLAASQPGPQTAPGPCLLIDRAWLRQSGAVALQPDPGGIWVRPARQSRRLWDSDQPLLTPVFLPAKGARLALR